MNIKRSRLNTEMVEPLKELTKNLLEQLEIAEKEINELEKSNTHYLRRFDEVSAELERYKIMVKEIEKETEEKKELVYDKMKRDYIMLNRKDKGWERNDKHE